MLHRRYDNGPRQLLSWCASHCVALGQPYTRIPIASSCGMSPWPRCTGRLPFLSYPTSTFAIPRRRNRDATRDRGVNREKTVNFDSSYRGKQHLHRVQIKIAMRSIETPRIVRRKIPRTEDRKLSNGREDKMSQVFTSVYQPMNSTSRQAIVFHRLRIYPGTILFAVFSRNRISCGTRHAKSKTRDANGRLR